MGRWERVKDWMLDSLQTVVATTLYLLFVVYLVGAVALGTILIAAILSSRGWL